MLRILATLLLSAIALAHAAPARAQSCGDTITHDITLTANLHCTAGWVALYVPVSGITIDLNGYTLSGNRGLVGIDLQEASSVRIINGSIRGFWGGVVGLRSHKLKMQNVKLEDLGTGISLNYSYGAQVIDNNFHGISGPAISFGVPLGAGYGAAGSHYIAYNRITGAGTGIKLCGYDNGNAVITGNQLLKIAAYGIHASDGSGSHQVKGNLIRGIENTGIVLRGSRANVITDNVLQEGRLGIAMTPQFTGECKTGPLTSPWIRDNRIESNHILKLEGGVTLGMGMMDKPLVFKNQIRFNDIHDDGTGLYFQEDAHGNDARGNDFLGTSTPIVDHGAYNRY
ncbi:right-handed parallel beta-helix repeat-containing protein [Luteimonas soli]|uniref:Right-handed parallel beta-helix repeat-containing protein n=1 Tax=Luteimonas soli TaxID=1648966 RepID=A0ABV7XKP2_9GAMM